MFIMKKEETDAIKAISGWYCSKCGFKTDEKSLKMYRDQHGKLPSCSNCGKTAWEYGVYPEFQG